MLTVDSFWQNFLTLPLPYKQVSDANYLIAYSGGCDSHVLLHLLSELKKSGKLVNVKAVHVNHQLHSESDQWAKHCVEQCEQYAIACDVFNVSINKQSNKGLEDAARTARYAILEECVTDNSYLLTAQHADDQVETFLLQSLRGGGVKGLASMPQIKPFSKGHLLRPLLHTRQEMITEYAKLNQLNWVDDPSNLNTDFDRNFLRKKVIPVLKQRWPSLDKTLSRLTQHQAEAAELIDALAEADLTMVQVEPDLIAIDKLKSLTLIRQKNVLRYWIAQFKNLTIPDNKHLMRILNEVIVASKDSQPKVQWHDTVVRRFQGNLYAQKIDLVKTLKPIEQWNPEQVYNLLGDSTHLSHAQKVVTTPSTGRGLSIEKLKNKKVSIRFRCGGEVCCPQGRGSQHHKLKNLFQEWQIAPWMRDQIPLIYVDDELAQVVGYCLCEPFAAEANEPSYDIVLQ